MKSSLLSLILFTFFFCLQFSSGVLAFGDSFSCSFGKQAACLDRGDKVCSSRAKCVNDDSICFEPHTCGYQGFVCKSDHEELAGEYENLLIKCKEVASDYDALVEDYNKLLRVQKELYSDYRNYRDCIKNALALEEANSCTWVE